MAPAPNSGAEWSDRITSESHGPFVTIATCLMITAMLLFFGIRMVIRWPWTKLAGLDDITTVLATVVGVGQSTCIFEAVHFGLGRHLDELDYQKQMSALKVIYASNILFVLALALSKLAVSLLILRLASRNNHILTARIIAGAIVVWGVVSVLVISLPSTTDDPWDYIRDNPETTRAWLGIGITSILFEITLAIFPVVLIYDLQMPLLSKVTVVIGFCFRLPIIVITVLRLVSIRSITNSENFDWAGDVTWNLVTPTIYQQIELHYSIIAATIPCMRLFLKNFNTGYLGTTADQVDPLATTAATKGSNSYGHSYALSSMRSGRTDSQSKEKSGLVGGGGGMKLRPDIVGRTTSKINHEICELDAESQSSGGEDGIVIRRTVQIDWGCASVRSSV